MRLSDTSKAGIRHTYKSVGKDYHRLWLFGTLARLDWSRFEFKFPPPLLAESRFTDNAVNELTHASRRKKRQARRLPKTWLNHTTVMAIASTLILKVKTKLSRSIATTMMHLRISMAKTRDLLTTTGTKDLGTLVQTRAVELEVKKGPSCSTMRIKIGLTLSCKLGDYWRRSSVNMVSHYSRSQPSDYLSKHLPSTSQTCQKPE
jgi:hypothetical protein